MEPFRLTVTQTSSLIQRNELSPSELLESLLERIDRLEPRLRAWVTIDRDGARTRAEEYSDEAERGTFRGPLHGIPLGVKDIFYTSGMRTTSGSKINADFVPTYDSTAVARLKEAGAIILGKTETTEFAAHDPAPTRNPWNMEHTPGGSSSGSAAAVSSGMCPAALGSQTGGSTIRPAAYCGIVGLKPTYGRVSRFGVFPLSWSLDHVGILARSVEDAALLLEVLAGHDPKDDTSSTIPVTQYRRALENPSIPRIGLLRGLFQENASDQVRRNLDATVERLLGSGADISDVRQPVSFSGVHAAHRVVMSVEAAAVHEETFRARMENYRPMIRGLIASGLLVPASAYVKSQRIRGRFIREMSSTLEGFDCLLTPSARTAAPRGLGSTGDPSFNSPWSFCGLPSITIPTGLTEDGLPLGMQLVGRPFEEERVLKMAYWCERTLGFGHEPHDITS